LKAFRADGESMKKIIQGLAAFMAIGSIFSATILPSSANTKPIYVPPDFKYGWVVQEFAGSEISTLTLTEAFSKPSSGKIPRSARCSEIGKGKVAYLSGVSCDPLDYPGGRVWANFQNLNLAVCNEQPRDCISEVFAADSSGKKIQGEFVGYVESDWAPEVAANNQTNNPRGVSSGIWKLEGVENSLGSHYYMVNFTLSGGRALYDRGKVVREFPADEQTFNITIRPVASESLKMRSFSSWEEYCIICEDMPTNFRFGVSAVVHQSVMNWYAGRLSEPLVEYKKVSSKYNRITISGNPVKIPTFRPTVSHSQASPQLLQIMEYCHNLDEESLIIRTKYPDIFNSCGGQYIQGSRRMQGGAKFDFMEVFRPLVGDKATSSRVVWTVRTVYPRIISEGNRTSIRQRFVQCSSPDRPAGISTTNSMIFEGYIPEFKNGYLNYRVSGMHYEEDGKTLFKGRYEMSIDENVARCVFGYPKSLASASVSVVNSDGAKSIATTTVGTKNGQLRLVANNFTFSDKTIRLQINVKGYATCVRGNSVRYIKGTQCPSGFKKRSK
jgi:hypothetical protein